MISYRLAVIRLLPLSDLLSVAVIGFRKNTPILSVAVYCLISLSVAVLWHNFAIGGGVSIKLQDPLVLLLDSTPWGFS